MTRLTDWRTGKIQNKAQRKGTDKELTTLTLILSRQGRGKTKDKK